MPRHPATQYVYVTRKKSESGQTGTATYDLPERGFIPEIVVRVFSTPTAVTDPALPVNDAITSIEISDGAQIIKSLTGNQAHGLEMIHKNHKRASTEVNDNAVEGYDDFILVLGATANGVRYAPDFSRFSNPQIKITWDYSITTGQFGATFDADASPVIKITVIAKVLRDASGFTHGYLKSSQIRTWTSVASATEQTEFPLGEKLFGFMIEAGYDDDDWTEDIESLKLDFDNGRFVPLDLKEEEIAPIQREWFGTDFELSFNADIKDTVEIDAHMGYLTAISINGVIDGGQILAGWPASRIGIEEVAIFNSLGNADATFRQYKIQATGFMPYQCWYAPMRIIGDGSNDIIETSQFGRIVLETTTGASPNTASTPAVVAEYLITT